MEANDFHTCQILSVVLNKNIPVPGKSARDGMIAFYEIIDFMLDRSVNTLEVREVLPMCKTALLGQLPWLTSVEWPTFNPDKTAICTWVERLIAKHGEIHSVSAVLSNRN